MIELFPHERAVVARTHLRFVRFDKLLNDGKADRGSRAPGFIALYLGDETDLILIDEGEPAAGVRFAPGGRSVVAVPDVVRRAETSVEWADVGFYHAPLTQLRAMYATAANAPTFALDSDALEQPGRLFSGLREREYDGVLELRDGSAAHYVVFHGGLPVHGYFAGQAGEEALAASIEQLFTTDGQQDLEATGYPSIDALPVQAPAALVRLYSQLVGDALTATSAVIGQEETVRCFKAGLSRARENHEELAHFDLSETGDVNGRPAVEAESLTDAVAAWLFEALSGADHAGGADPADLLEQVTREHRLTLDAQKFFTRFPWPVGR